MRSAASGWAWVRAAEAMAARVSRGVEQAVSASSSLPGMARSRLVQHDGGAGLDHLLGVALLMIVGGGGEGNQQGRLAGGGELGHGGCAAAGHDQVRLREAGGHVVEKWLDLPARGIGAAGGVGGLGGLGMARAALMKDGEAGDGVEQRGDDFGQGLVEEARALRAAEDEQMRRGGRRAARWRRTRGGRECR